MECCRLRIPSFEVKEPRRSYSYVSVLERGNRKHFKAFSQASLRAGVKRKNQDTTSNDSLTSLLAKMGRSMF